MIDFTLGICCLSRDFPADPRRLGRKWRMRSRFSALSVGLHSSVQSHCHTLSSSCNLFSKPYIWRYEARLSSNHGLNRRYRRSRCIAATRWSQCVVLFPRKSSKWAFQVREVVRFGLPRCKNLWTFSLLGLGLLCWLLCFLCFTSLVSFTGSYTEVEPPVWGLAWWKKRCSLV